MVVLGGTLAHTSNELSARRLLTALTAMWYATATSMSHDSSCPHLIAATARAPVEPNAEGCSECLASGGEWMHLRLCLTCGHVGCCDNSPHQHATKHHHATKHPVIRSYEPDEAWGYCYVDDVLVEELPGFEGESAREHYWPR